MKVSVRNTFLHFTGDDEAEMRPQKIKRCSLDDKLVQAALDRYRTYDEFENLSEDGWGNTEVPLMSTLPTELERYSTDDSFENPMTLAPLAAPVMTASPAVAAFEANPFNRYWSFGSQDYGFWSVANQNIILFKTVTAFAGECSIASHDSDLRLDVDGSDCPDDVSSCLDSWFRPEVHVDKQDREIVETFVSAEVLRWPKHDRESGRNICLQALDIALAAEGGLLIFVSPSFDLQQLKVESTDGGYLGNRLQCPIDGCKMTIADPICRQGILDFANHKLDEHDRWPSHYHDKAAVGLPKDGAIAITSHGHVSKAAVKILGLVATFKWPNHGLKHETAVALAATLRCSVVVIRSSHGRTKVLLGSDAGGKAFEINDHH